ncbi:MAG TPA: hypothetical protein VK783_04285 [Bacteroidia bacterium]|nr:hypothetical protein [Bacteroidia bacterium]
MKGIAIGLVLFALLAFKGGEKTKSKQPCVSALDGKAYRYTVVPQRPNWTFYFLFYCEGDSLRGVIMGPTMQTTSNGLFFRAYVNNVRIVSDTVSFNFIEGELYRVPFTLSNYSNYGGPVAFGFAQDRLFYKGVIKGDSMMDLKCQNKYFACGADSLVFWKMK